MKRIILSTVMMMAATVYTQLFAQKPAIVEDNEKGWTHIGHTTASFKMQNESIAVLGADEFHAIKLKVTEAGLQIERLQVFYESGEMEEIDVTDQFAKGTESGKIHLKHPDRDIKKIAFTYKTLPNAKGEKADIDVYGLKTNQPAGADSFKDEKAEIKEEAREAEQELNEEVNEAERELDEAEDDLEYEEERDLGDAVEEGAKDAASAIKDKKIKNKVGPGGETAYVDDAGKIYIINNLGEKQYITKLELKDKPDND